MKTPLIFPYLYTEGVEIDRWLRDSLRGEFGDIVDDPTKYSEIIKKFETKEHELVHIIGEKALILKKNGKIIAIKTFE